MSNKHQKLTFNIHTKKRKINENKKKNKFTHCSLQVEGIDKYS